MKKIIEQVAGWRDFSAKEILAILQEKTIQYVDKKQYRLDDIAKLIGDSNMNIFLDVVRAAGYDWMITQAASGFFPYEDPINSRLRALGHPLSLQIADHTNRMISVLEQNGLDPTETEIEDAKALLLHEERQARLLQSGSFRWNVYVDAVHNLKPGDPDPNL